MNEDKLRQSSKQLAETYRIALETEEISRSTLTELHRQGDQIKKTSTRVDQVGSSLEESNRRINKLNTAKCLIS